jgi:hypothetical protein
LSNFQPILVLAPVFTAFILFLLGLFLESAIKKIKKERK